MFKVGVRPSGIHSVATLFPLAQTGYSQLTTDLFPGMSSDGTDMTIPIAALADHGLTAALADTTTGDARALAYAFVARVEEWYIDLATANRPKALVATPKLGIGFSSSDFPDKEKTQLSFTIYRERPEGTVAAEPS